MKWNSEVVFRRLACLVLVLQFIPSWWWFIFVTFAYGVMFVSIAMLLVLPFSIFSIKFIKNINSDNKGKRISSYIIIMLNIFILILQIYFFSQLGLLMFPAFD